MLSLEALVGPVNENEDCYSRFLLLESIRPKIEEKIILKAFTYWQIHFSRRKIIKVGMYKNNLDFEKSNIFH